jgi:hypothetical protein
MVSVPSARGEERFMQSGGSAIEISGRIGVQNAERMEAFRCGEGVKDFFLAR